MQSPFLTIELSKLMIVLIKMVNVILKQVIALLILVNVITFFDTKFLKPYINSESLGFVYL